MELHATIKCCLAFFEAFRRLGFKPTEIFFACDPNVIGMVLRAEGKPDYRIMAGPMDEAVLAQWADATARWNSGDLSYVEKSLIWREFMPTDTFVGLTCALLIRGYTLPGIDEPALQEAKRLLSLHLTPAAKA